MKPRGRVREKVGDEEVGLNVEGEKISTSTLKHAEDSIKESYHAI